MTTVAQTQKATKKSNKIIDTTQDNTTLSPFRSWADFIDNDFSALVHDISWRRKFCLTLLKWADEDDSIELEQFYLKYRFDRRRIYEWRDKYPEIGNVFDIVKIFIGMRRRIGAVTRKYDKDVVVKDWHRYDPEYDEVNKYHVKLKAMQVTIQNQMEGKNADDRYIMIKDMPVEAIESKDE